MRKLLLLLLAGMLVKGAFAQTENDHLIITEVVLTPTAGEFIEIYNPTGFTTPLDVMYLSDSQDYGFLPGQFGDGPAPNLDSDDFMVRFPDGTSIDPGEVVVVAFSATDFFLTYAQQPDFEIFATDLVVPDMVAAYGGSIGGSAGLTDAGEGVHLFTWSGVSDLIDDIDLINAGVPTGSEPISDKTGVSVDGPDANSSATSYDTDASTMGVMASAPASGESANRIALEGSNETLTGGNGLTGHDETTEDISTTWETSGFSAPNPGVWPPPNLPVELSAFDARPDGRDVILTWKTESETGAAGFGIERSDDSGDFREVAYVESRGSLDKGASYSHRVPGAEVGTHRFRLRLVDLAGTSSYSDEIEVAIVLPTTYELSEPYPNPFNASASIDVTVNADQQVTVSVYNLLGEHVGTLFSGRMQGNDTETFHFEGSTLPSGLYVFRVDGETFSSSRPGMLLR